VTNPLDIIWPSVDSSRPRFTADEVRGWPIAFTKRLTARRLLIRAESSDHVVCPACGDRHVEEVIPRKGRDGRVRFFIRCPEALRVEVPEESVVQWTIDFDAVARAIAGSMSLQGRCTLIVPGRLWRLGRDSWRGASRGIVFVRGLQWPDGKQLADRIGTHGRTIVLIAEHVPPPEFWAGLPPPTVALTGITTLGESGIELDRAYVAALVEQVDATNRAIQPVALTPQQQKKLFRQQAATVLKSYLKDDELIDAYRQYGSSRKAAVALSKKHGVKISKDAVARAVQKRGGPDVVKSDHDSCSVRRTVASQRRDRKKSFAAPSEPPGSE